MSDVTAEHAILADEALGSGKSAAGLVGGVAMVAVPDVVIAQGAANGLAAPDTLMLEREDGRMVYFFLDPRVDP